jgi:phthiocerol/phenolphthiocerol synthesis type-I polyketide synthase E
MITDILNRTSDTARTPASVQPKRASTSSLDEVIAKLIQIWQDMLVVQPITPDQNYFELGGDSILAVQLFTQVEQEFQVKLPLATLFDAPTIAELAHILVKEAPVSEWSPLVRIQTSGTRPPFFCMHGAGGNVLIYRDLARHLGPDQPFYGLQSQGLDGKYPPITKIEEMAALYVKHIRKAAPHGPYFLGGYCMGGTIAFEVAQQLQSAGKQVALLALFDTMDWSKIALPSFGGKCYRAWQQVIFHAANFLCLDFRGKIRFFSEKAKTFRNRLPVWKGMLFTSIDGHSSTGTSDSRVLGQIWRTNDLACINYVPRPYAGVITDFRPMEQYSMYDRADAKWDRLALNGQEIVTLPVYPAGMLLSPFVEHLALALRNSIDSAMHRCGVA